MGEVLTGGCLCGAIRYRAEADETIHYLCHCTDCQRYGGSAFHSAIVVAADALKTEGAPRVYTKLADSGRDIARYFCGDCGGHLFTSPWPEATRFSIKSGTLDDPGAYRPAHEIWQLSKLAWLEAEGRDGHQQGFEPPVSVGSAEVAD